MSEVDHILTSNTEQGANLKEFIQVYKTYLNERSTDVVHGEKMLELGAKTAIIQEFEQFLVNPIQNLIDIKKSIDINLVQIVDRFISLFITKSIEGHLITSAFRRAGSGNSLFYGIILEEDTFENRDKVLDFLSFYNTLEFADKIPVYFQFLSEDVKDTFKKVEYIA